ncbi:hypothetical protein KA005_47440, partial [bacterium]|nr:hypothetical protein [bacterium]
NVVCTRFADKLQLLRRRSGIFPEIEVFEYTPYQRRLLNEGNYIHATAAFRTFEIINIPYLLEKSSPQLSSSAGGIRLTLLGFS